MLRTSAFAIGKLSFRGGGGGRRSAVNCSSPSTWRSSAISSTCCSSLFSSSATSPPLLQSAAQQQQQQQKLLPIKTTFDLPDPAAVFDGRGDAANQHTSCFPLAKIVATIGPTSEQKQPLLDVSAAGMRIMRLNFSHATVEEVELRVANLAAAQKALGASSSSRRRVSQDVRAILLDTKGPEIRSGKLANDISGHATVSFVAGEEITLHCAADSHFKTASTAKDLYIDLVALCQSVKLGGKVLLDDGAIALTITSINPSTFTVGCVVDNSGELRSRAGVNLPLADTSSLPALSEKDKADIKYGMSAEVDIDFVAASFVQTAAGVEEIRRHIQACAAEMPQYDQNQDHPSPLPLIISKIESASALKHFDEILQASDGIMVARGDLGVEIPLTQVTNAQKEMVAACNAVGKPVIVATQMLESMAKNPRPTRAEVADCTNAIYDGADCLMLSGETAKGKYPTETVKTMNEIIRASERYRVNGAAFTNTARGASPATIATPRFVGNSTSDAAIAKAAVTAATERGAAAILVLTHYTTLPRLVAAYRPNIPILSFCPTAKIGRQLQIHRAIYPIVLAEEECDDARAVQEAKELGYVKEKDEVVIVEMHDSKIGRTATLEIAVVP